jgi:hypothetical protein
MLAEACVYYNMNMVRSRTLSSKSMSTTELTSRCPTVME